MMHHAQTGLDFGSCYPRRDTIIDFHFESNAKTAKGLTTVAKRKATQIYADEYGVNAKACGIILMTIDGNAA